MFHKTHSKNKKGLVETIHNVFYLVSEVIRFFLR